MSGRKRQNPMRALEGSPIATLQAMRVIYGSLRIVPTQDETSKLLAALQQIDELARHALAFAEKRERTSAVQAPL